MTEHYVIILFRTLAKLMQEYLAVYLQDTKVEHLYPSHGSLVFEFLHSFKTWLTSHRPTYCTSNQT